MTVTETKIYLSYDVTPKVMWKALDRQEKTGTLELPDGKLVMFQHARMNFCRNDNNLDARQYGLEDETPGYGMCCLGVSGAIDGQDPKLMVESQQVNFPELSTADSQHEQTLFLKENHWLATPIARYDNSGVTPDKYFYFRVFHWLIELNDSYHEAHYVPVKLGLQMLELAGVIHMDSGKVYPSIPVALSRANDRSINDLKRWTRD